jgi:Zn-dependent M28 family amino/carboxypeptidase
VRSVARFLLALCLLAVAALAGCDSGGGSEPEPQPRPAPAITSKELTGHLAALQRIADANGGNRSAGTHGYDASADYVAARLSDAGWKVTRQPVPYGYFRLDDASLTVGGRRLERAKQFQVLSYSGSGRAVGRLRAAGTGCSEDDYAGLGPSDIPLVDRGICFFRDKARNAERAGARALVVSEVVRTRRGVPSGTLAGTGVGIPVVLVSLGALGGYPEGAPATVAVDAVSRRGRTENVVAETPGGSADRVVMAGAHLDSVAGGPGINDNGSGVATLIEAAEAIGPRPQGAKVRLGFWAAEELGLVGSREYVRSLDGDQRRRIRAYLNLDMLGSPNPVPQLYRDGDPQLARVLRRSAAGPLGGIAAGESSDHAPFEAAGIPVNGLYTGSTERGPGGRPRDPCYHLACDTLHDVNRAVLLRIARATARALRTLSSRHN